MTRLRSTDDGPRGLAATVPLEVYEELPPSLLATWGLTPSGGGHTRDSKHLSERMQDAALVLDLLRGTSPVGLIMLEVLVESGGLCESEDCFELVAQRTGTSIRTAKGALRELMSRGLAIAVMAGYDHAAALLEPNASAIADAVFGVSLPAPPSETEFACPAIPDAARVDALSAATLARHCDLRGTMKGRLHKGDIKKHARRLGIEADTLLACLEAAVRLRVLVKRGGRFELDESALFACARGQGGRLPSALRRRLEVGPVCEELLVRQEARFQLTPYLGFAGELSRARHNVKNWVASIDGVVRTRVGEHTWLSLVELPPLPEAPIEGFVTPSLEVLVGPDPDARVVARVGLGAELVKVDRVLTFRIRPETIRAMVAAGGSADTFLEALDLVGKHGVPDSVRAQVRDWAERAKVGRSAPLASFQVAARHHEAVSRAIGKRLVGTLGPGHFAVAYRDGHTVLRQLNAAGFEFSDVLPDLAKPPPAPKEEDELVPFRGVDLLGAPAPDPELRERVQAEMAGGFTESPSEPDLYRPDLSSRTAGEYRALILDRMDPAFSASVRRAVDVLLKKHAELEVQLEAWAGSFDAESRELALSIARNPLHGLPILCLAPKLRRSLLASPRTPDEALSEAMSWVERRKVSPEGRRMLKAFSKPSFADWMTRVMGHDGLDEEPPEQSELERLRAIQHLLRHDGEPALAWWRSGATVRCSEVWLDELVRRGNGQVVLLTEVEDERSRLVPLDDLVAILPLGLF